jgi:hypothetical protein
LKKAAKAKEEKMEQASEWLFDYEKSAKKYLKPDEIEALVKLNPVSVSMDPNLEGATKRINRRQYGPKLDPGQGRITLDEVKQHQ